MNYTISMFIDNELSIDEKIVFLETIQKNKSYANEALELLHQEKLIRGDVVNRVPVVAMKVSSAWKRFMEPFFRPMGLVASTLAVAVIFLIFSIPSPTSCPISKRFVVYRPDVSQVEITGNFTDWKRVPMHKIGTSGYWEIILNLMEGEHRFTYILEGREPFADPTILTRESDDFGGENSIFYMDKIT